MTSKELRGAILRILHTRWMDTGEMLETVTTPEVAAELGIEEKAVDREVEYLWRKGLLEDLGFHGEPTTFHPTPAGIDYVENPEGFPQFQNLIVISAGGDISLTGSQVGSVGNFQSSVIGWNPDQVVSLIRELQARLAQADAPEDIRHDVAADLEALSAQARRKNPNRAVLLAILKGLSATVQTAAALQQLWPVIEQLRALLGGG
jgi:hypothetical protein